MSMHLHNAAEIIYCKCKNLTVKSYGDKKPNRLPKVTNYKVSQKTWHSMQIASG